MEEEQTLSLENSKSIVGNRVAIYKDAIYPKLLKSIVFDRRSGCESHSNLHLLFTNKRNNLTHDDFDGV
jgi:nitrous oxidase accessory protein NosD